MRIQIANSHDEKELLHTPHGGVFWFNYFMPVHLQHVVEDAIAELKLKNVHTDHELMFLVENIGRMADAAIIYLKNGVITMEEARRMTEVLYRIGKGKKMGPNTDVLSHLYSLQLHAKFSMKRLVAQWHKSTQT